jgi:hypothetical protein
VTTVPDIPVVHISALDGESPAVPGAFMPGQVSWAAVEVPRGRRLSPVVLATLGVVAGIGAMALGTAAVISAGRSDAPTSGNDSTGAATPQAAPSTPIAVRRVLALLAKPSTERIAFSRSGGRLVLAVGSGGRAAILVRGLERAAPGTPYRAWIVAAGRPPVRAAQFVGTERAVLLTVPVPRGSSVAISAERPVMGRPAQYRVRATRE